MTRKGLETLLTLPKKVKVRNSICYHSLLISDFFKVRHVEVVKDHCKQKTQEDQLANEYDWYKVVDRYPAKLVRKTEHCVIPAVPSQEHVDHYESIVKGKEVVPGNYEIWRGLIGHRHREDLKAYQEVDEYEENK